MRPSRHADGWFITIDGEVVESVGKFGVVRDKHVAEPIYRTIKARNPGKDVKLVGAFRVRS